MSSWIRQNHFLNFSNSDLKVLIERNLCFKWAWIYHPRYALRHLGSATLDQPAHIHHFGSTNLGAHHIESSTWIHHFGSTISDPPSPNHHLRFAILNSPSWSYHSRCIINISQLELFIWGQPSWIHHRHVEFLMHYFFIFIDILRKKDSVFATSRPCTVLVVRLLHINRVS